MAQNYKNPSRIKTKVSKKLQKMTFIMNFVLFIYSKTRFSIFRFDALLISCKNRRKNREYVLWFCCRYF